MLEYSIQDEIERLKLREGDVQTSPDEFGEAVARSQEMTAEQKRAYLQPIMIRKLTEQLKSSLFFQQK